MGLAKAGLGHKSQGHNASTDRAYFAQLRQKRITHTTTIPLVDPVRMRRAHPSQFVLQLGMDGGELLLRRRLVRPLDNESLLF